MCRAISLSTKPFAALPKTTRSWGLRGVWCRLLRFVKFRCLLNQSGCCMTMQRQNLAPSGGTIERAADGNEDRVEVSPADHSGYLVEAFEPNTTRFERCRS